MRKRSDKHTFSENLNLRKRQIETELAKIPSGPTRERLVQQIKQIEATEMLDGWLRTPGLRLSE